MAKGGGIPEATSEFHNYVKTLIPYLEKHKERLRVMTHYLAELKTLLGEKNRQGKYPENSWNDLHERRTNPVTRSMFVNKELRRLRLFFTKRIRNNYANMPPSHWNASDYNVFGRAKPVTTRSKIPLTSAVPRASIELQRHLIIKVRFQNSETPKSKKKPYGIIGVSVETTIGINGKPVTDRVFTGKFLYTFQFSPKQMGGKFTLRAYYSGSRGEQGRWGNTVTTIII